MVVLKKTSLLFSLLLFLSFFAPSLVRACNLGVCVPPNCTSGVCDTCGWCPVQPTHGPADLDWDKKVNNKLLPDSLSELKGTTFINNLLNFALKSAFVVGSVAFFFMFLLGGIDWLTAGGDKTKLEGAQKRITNAGIGLFLLFAFFAIIALINTLFGVNILEFNIPTV